MTDRTPTVESGRAIMASSRLDRKSGPQDEKFALGDLLADLADVADEELDAIAAAIGYNLTGSLLRSYRDVAQAWPPERRVAASWTTHRTLKKAANRFDLIAPKMTLRQAQVAIGKNPADTEHPSRWDLERRVPFIIVQLQDSATTKAVREQLEGRKRTRAAKAVVKMVEEDLSAEYRNALHEFREKRDAKHPERMAYEALFKLREFVEYARAVGKASNEENSFLPAHHRPELIAAVRELALSSIDMIASFSLQEKAATEAIEMLGKHLDEMRPQQLSTTFQGDVITGYANGSSTYDYDDWPPHKGDSA